MNEVTKQKSTTIAGQVIGQQQRLIERASKLSDSMESRLAPILSAVKPPEGVDKEMPEPYPPLFEAFRDQTNAMNNIFSTMESILDRVAL